MHNRIYFIISILLLFSLNSFAQTYEELVQKSYDFIDKNDLVSAETCLKEALHKEPANPLNYALLTNLGTVQRRQDKKEDALISYSAALSSHPKNLTILENRASLYMELYQTEKALSDYNTILVIEPHHQEALFQRGLIFIQKKNFMWAEQDFAKLLELNKSSLNARKGYAILEKARGNFRESEIIYNYLISKLPKEWILYEGRADLYFRMGKNSRAMADINKVFTESQPTATLYVLRGKIKLAQYERDRAVEDFNKALEMGYDPKTIEELIKLAGVDDNDKKIGKRRGRKK